MSDIIGKRFRRNVYGPSIWEDTVAEVIYESENIIDPKVKSEHFDTVFKKLAFIKKHKIGTKLIPKVLGKNTLKAYDFDEIIFYND